MRPLPFQLCDVFTDRASGLPIEQGFEIGRPSTLHARAVGSAGRIERVEAGGSAVVVGRGEFDLPGIEPVPLTAV